MTDTDAISVYRFDNCELDVQSRQLRFSGTSVEVQPRVFDLIEYLVQERGRAVSKDELFEKVWPNVIVSDASLSQTIKRARNVFREHGLPDDIIKTVHSRGYRFDADVVEIPGGQTPAEPAAETVAASSSRLFVAVAAVASVVLIAVLTVLYWPQRSSVPDELPANSVVVLPFKNLTGDPSFSWYPEGVTETLSHGLATVNGLRVIGRASAAQFRDTDLSHQEIGRQLAVANIIEGSVLKSGDEVRIVATMIRSHDGSVRWSETYPGQFDNIFAVQDALAAKSIQHMEVILAQELETPEQLTDNRNAEAWQYYLQANEQKRKRTETSFARAVELYRQALRIDPRFKEALVGLAEATFRQANLGSIPREQGFSETVALCKQALSIDQEYVDAHIMLGEVQHRHFWRFAEARQSYEKAMLLEPGDADTHAAYSRFLSKIGEYDRAVAEARIARELNPLSAGAASSLVLRLVRVGEVEEARAVLDSMREQYPENGDLPWLESLYALAAEDYSAVLLHISEEEYDYLRLSISAMAYHHLGRTAQSQQALDHLIETDPGATFQIAEVYAVRGEDDRAVEWLQRAIEAGDPGLSELLSSMSFDSLHDDARFHALLEQVGLPSPPPSS